MYIPENISMRNRGNQLRVHANHLSTCRQFPSAVADVFEFESGDASAAKQITLQGNPK